MTAAKRSRKIKQRGDPLAKLVKQIGLPEAQRKADELRIIDAVNPTAGETRTVRRRTWVERLVSAKVIEEHQARAVQWYADQHEFGYATVGCTANYEGAGGGGFGATDLLARYKAQQEARDNYGWARTFIPADLLYGFERVVLDQMRLNSGGFEEGLGSERTRFRNRRAAFRLACDRLHIGIAHLVDSDNV